MKLHQKILYNSYLNKQLRKLFFDKGILYIHINYNTFIFFHIAAKSFSLKILEHMIINRSI